MTSYPTHKQIQDIVTTVLNDIVLDDTITESQIHEAGRGVAAQITRWDRDVNPTTGSKAHHILNTLAGSDTPVHLDQILTDTFTAQAIAPALDNLMVAHYVEVTPKGYRITPTGLRALGAAPVKTYTLSDQVLNGQILRVVRDADVEPTDWDIRSRIELGPAEAIEPIREALDNLVDTGYLHRITAPGNTVTYRLSDNGRNAVRVL